ncbi:unnamed protein product [Leptosia nina]|uniref:Uncharacterized protein n=1 Tax=Leptosia nina TaxID=320188 RepID=A0AAV1JUF4_9NEOP
MTEHGGREHRSNEISSESPLTPKPPVLSHTHFESFLSTIDARVAARHRRRQGGDWPAGCAARQSLEAAVAGACCRRPRRSIALRVFRASDIRERRNGRPSPLAGPPNHLSDF